jgi:hypothetical protein
MGLQSVLKIRGKTSKLFALQASPYKGSKPWVNLDPFIFSMLKHVSKHPVVAAERFWVVNGLLSTEFNVTGHTGTDTIYRENTI